MDEPGVPKEKETIGPLAGILILVLLFLAGGLYFFFDQSKRFHTPPVEENINA